MAMHDVRARQFPLYSDFMHTLPPTSVAPGSAQLPSYSAAPPPPQLAAPQSYRYTSHDSDFVGGPLGPGGGPGEYRMYPPSPPYYPQGQLHAQHAQHAQQPALQGPLQPPMRTLSLPHHALPPTHTTPQQLYPSYPREVPSGVPSGVPAVGPVPSSLVAPAGPGAPSGPGGPVGGPVGGSLDNSPPRMIMNGFPPTMPFTRVPSPFSHSHQPLTSARRQEMTGIRKSAKRAHNCMVCGKVFARPSALQTHFYSHTGEKPFKCEHAGCGRSFSVVSNLRRHNQKVHDEKRN